MEEKQNGTPLGGPFLPGQGGLGHPSHPPTRLLLSNSAAPAPAGLLAVAMLLLGRHSYSPPFAFWFGVGGVFRSLSILQQTKLWANAG